MPGAFAFALAVICLCALTSALTVVVGTIMFATAEPPPQVAERPAPRIVEVGDDVVKWPAQAKPDVADKAKLNSFQLGQIVGIIVVFLIGGAMTALSTWVLYGLYQRDDRALTWANVLAGLAVFGTFRSLGHLLGFQEVTTGEAYLAWADLVAFLATASLLALLRLKSVVRFYSYTGHIPNLSQARTIFSVSLVSLLVLMFGLNPYLFKLLGVGQGGRQEIAQGNNAPNDPKLQQEPLPRKPPQFGLPGPRPQPPAGGAARDWAKPPDRPAAPPERPSKPPPPPPPLDLQVPENPAPLPAGLMERVDERIVKMQGLIAYFAFEEESGDTVYDASPFRNHASGHDFTRCSGKRGRGIRFNGGLIQIPPKEYFNLNGENGVAIALWCRPESRTGHLVSLRGLPPEDRPRGLAHLEGAVLRLGINFFSQPSATMRPDRIQGQPFEVHGEMRHGQTDQRWQHLVLNKRPGKALEIWENGLKLAGRDPQWDLDRHLHFESIYIGTDKAEPMAREFVGELDEICIFRRHLERDEIQSLARATRPPDGAAGATPPPSSGASVRPTRAEVPRPAPSVAAAPETPKSAAPKPEPSKPAPAMPPGLPANLTGKLNQTILGMPDLLIYLPMAEGEGTKLFDAGPNQRHAQLFNAAWIDGRGGKVVRFNGRTSYARIPAGAPLEFGTDDEFAVSIYFRSKTGRGPLFAFRGDERENRVWVSGMFDVSRNLLGLVRSGSEFGFPSVARVFPIETKQYLDNAWHHVVLNRRPIAPFIELWVDGRLAASSQEKPKGEGVFTPTFICLGMDWVFANGRPEGPPYFEGDMTEFCVFGRALSEDDVNKLRGPK